MTRSLSAGALRARIFWMLVLLLPATTTLGQINQETCLANSDEAETQIADGFFDEAIDLLTPCEDVDFLDQNEQTQIFRLLAKAYLAKQYVSEARDAINRLLDLAPNYTPDVNLDSQLFRDLITELRSQRVPPTPEAFVIEVENGRVNLSWTRINDEQVDYIRVMRGESSNSMAPLDTVSAAATGYTDSSTEIGMSYFYSLQTMGTNGVPGNQANALQITVTGPPVTEAEPVDTQKDSPPTWRKWAFIGGGLVAGGVVAAVALGGGGGGEVTPPNLQLPGPPGIE